MKILIIIVWIGARNFVYCYSLVIRPKSESPNGVNKKTKHPKILEN